VCRYSGGGGEGSGLDRLLPAVGTGLSPRKRTTSQCKSEPPLLRTSKRTIYTAGRPPWYNEHGAQSKEAFVIGEPPAPHIPFNLHENKVQIYLLIFTRLCCETDTNEHDQTGTLIGCTLCGNVFMFYVEHGLKCQWPSSRYRMGGA